MKAVFQDKDGRTYSALVVLFDGKWQMVTSEGTQDITASFNDDDAGSLTFVGYREDDSDPKPIDVEPKLPGESSLQQLQRAAAKVEAEHRGERERQRRETVDALNQIDPLQIAQERRINNMLATMKGNRGAQNGD